MQKTCTQCLTPKPLTDFPRRAASPDGYAPLCLVCKREASRAKYATDPATRAATLQRVKRTQRQRFERSPAYKRAFYLWGSTKRRTRIPPWVSIADFAPVCQQAIDAGDKCVLDHIIPLRHPLVSGLHVPSNLRVLTAAQNRIAWELTRRPDYLDLLPKILGS